MRKRGDQFLATEPRCMWCCFPLNRSPRAVCVELDPFTGEWCTANCAVSYFKVYRRELAGGEFVRVLQAATDTASDVEWGPAPEPQAFEWWRPGGRSREEFLHECRVISMRPFPVARDPVDTVRRNYNMRELFRLNAPERAAPAKRARMEARPLRVVGGAGRPGDKTKTIDNK